MGRLNTKVEPRKVAVKDLVVDLSDGVGLTSIGYENMGMLMGICE